MKIEFTQPKPRVEDWRVKVGGRTIGSVWRAGDHYIANIATAVRAPTKEAAFLVARQQAKGITAA
jgi:hypothetical protein